MTRASPHVKGPRQLISDCRETTTGELACQNVIEWDKIEPKTVIPGFHGKFAHSNTMTFVLWDIDKGAILPEHSHIHEQVVHVYEGELEVTVDGQDDGAARAAASASSRRTPCIPGRALTDCRVMDAFYPLREDYMKGGAPSVLAERDEDSRT